MPNCIVCGIWFENRRGATCSKKCSGRAAKKKYQEANIDQIRKRRAELNKAKIRELRDRLFDILGGPRCVRCGFVDKRALQFDHINGGGNHDIKTRGLMQDRRRYYKSYVDNPPLAKQTLQVLCSNCNWIKRDEDNQKWKYNYQTTVATWTV